MAELELNAIKAIPKTGNEELYFENESVGYTLLDFWKWSVSDILSNATRGRFAEFVVGVATNINIHKLRDEWDSYDLTTQEGVKIEVKSSAYIQSWNQRKFSTISFSIKPSMYWDAKDGDFRGDSKRHADLYVFCLLKHKEQETINPLKLEQWEFFVLPTYKLDNYTRSQSSITLNSLQKLTHGISYNELNAKIYKAYKEQNENINKKGLEII